MSLLMAIFLGFVQGVTEFLPVSSSGHLSILQNIFNLHYSEAEHMFFDVLLHMGTLAAVFIVYRKDIKQMISETLGALTGKDEAGISARGGRLSPNVRTALFVVIGTIPLFIILPFYDKVESLYSNTIFIAFALIVTGAILYITDKMEPGNKNEKTMTLTDSVIIGAAQACAVIPGLSRSGATVSAGISRGLKKDFALKFSMLLSIPAVLGSLLVTLIKAISAGITWSLFPIYLVGAVVAGVTGYFALNVFRYLIAKNKFGVLAYYCFGVGALTLILSIIL